MKYFTSFVQYVVLVSFIFVCVCSNPKKPTVVDIPEVLIEIVTTEIMVTTVVVTKDIVTVVLKIYQAGNLKRSVRIPYAETDRAIINASDIGGTAITITAEGLDADDRILYYGYLDVGIINPERSRELSIVLDWVVLNPETSGFPGRYVNGITVDAQEEVWVATENSGVCRYGASVWRSYDDTYGLPTGPVHAVFCDRTNRIWAGTHSGAVHFNHQTGMWAVHDSLHGVEVYCFAEHATLKTLYIGTNNGLYCMEENGAWSHPLAGYPVTTIVPSIGGDTVWCGTSNSGVLLATDSLEQIFSTTSGLPEVTIWALTMHTDGTLWVGTSRGMAIYDGIGFTEVAEGVFDSPGIHGIAIDRTDFSKQWVISPYTVYVHSASAWNHYPIMLDQLNYHSLYIDARNYKWFATRGSGVILCTSP